MDRKKTEVEPLQWYDPITRSVWNALRGFLGKTAVQPLGRWKLILQTHRNNSMASSLVGRGPGASIRSFPNEVLSLLRARGAKACVLELWQGNVPAGFKAGWFTFWLFSSQTVLSNRYPSDRLSPWIVASTTAWFAQTMAQPFDQWVQHLNVQSVKDRSRLTIRQRTQQHWELLRSLFHQRILFRGYWMTMIATVPYNTGLLLLQRHLEKEHGWNKAVAGMTAGMMMTTGLFWQDTIRRVKQASSASAWTCTRELFVEGRAMAPMSCPRSLRFLYGIKRFYCGYGPTVIKTGINNGVRFLFG